MEQILDDKSKLDVFHYCTKTIRFPKAKILELVLAFFKAKNSKTVNLWEVAQFLKKQLGVGQINNRAIRELIGNEENDFAYIQKTIESYNRYSDNKVTEDDLSCIPFISRQDDLRIKQSKNVKEKIKEEDAIEYYYCSKLIRFPLKDVVKVIYDFYLELQSTSFEINQIYNHLILEFGVGQFNRSNLITLLGSSKIVPFSTVKDLYIRYNVESKVEDQYDLKMLKFVFEINRNLLADIVNALGKDLMISMLQQGISNTLDSVNALNLFFDEEAACTLELKDKRRNKLLDKNNTRLFVNLLSMFSDDELVEILKDEKQINDVISMYIEEKKIEQEKESIKKTILYLLDFVHEDNKIARLKCLFSHSLAEIFAKQKLVNVEDLVKINKRTAVECYPQKEALINIVKRLQISLPDYLNERFKHVVQMVNKDYKPNSNWENWVSIIEARAKGGTLEQSGSHLGVTRERVRQLERKYLEAFNNLYNAKNGNFKNLIRAFVKDSLFISDEDIKTIFSFNPLVFKYLLVNIEIDGLGYIQELDKFYFIDDYDWYKELVMYSENMPAQLHRNEIDKYVNEALNNLAKNDVIITYDDCYKIVMQDYKVLGEIYSKNKLNLSQKFKSIMQQYYPNGVNIYDEEFLSDFRNIYAKLYNNEKIKSDHAITSIIARVGMLVGRGQYKLNADIKLPVDLVSKLREFINKQDIVFVNNIFHEFEDGFNSLGIANRYYMQSLLKLQLPEYYYTKDYVSVSKKDYSVYDEIISYIKNLDCIVTIEELRKKFAQVSDIILLNALNNENIVNLHRKYIFVDNIKYDESTIEKVESIINSMVSNGQIRHANELYLKLMFSCPEFLEKYRLEGQFELFSIVSNIYKGKFTFKRPFFAKCDVSIKGRFERVLEFVNEHERILIDEILEFANENKLFINSILDFIDSLDDYIFKNSYEIEKIDSEIIDQNLIEKIDKILSVSCLNDDFISSKNFNGYHLLGGGVDWNCWILYSIVKKFSKSFNVITQSRVFKNKNNIIAYPIFVKKSLPAGNYEKFIKFLSEHSNLNYVEFEKYKEIKGIN